MPLQKYVCGTNFEFKHIESERYIMIAWIIIEHDKIVAQA
jgi:hypothetical protein